jgi:hypothetical protein
MLTEVQYNNYIEAGLLDDEIKLLDAPLANLNDQQRMVATHALNKYDTYVYSKKVAERTRIESLSEEERIATMKPAVWTEGIYRG